SFSESPRSTLSPLSLHDALPISSPFAATAKLIDRRLGKFLRTFLDRAQNLLGRQAGRSPRHADQILAFVGIHEPGGIKQRPFLRSEEHTSELQSREKLVCRLLLE